MKNGIIIVISILVGTFLTIGGLFMTLKDFFSPSGGMFEGVVLLSLGIVTLLLLVVANALGKTITSFAEIMDKQSQLHDTINRNKSTGFPGIFGMPPGTATIMDLNTGNIKTANMDGNDMAKNIHDILNAAMQTDMRISPEEPEASLEQLESMLSDAVASDDFERAEKLKEIILEKKSNKNRGSGDNEKK